jgi:electron transport complex protein RnfC
MKLVPSELSITLEKERVDLAQQYNIMDCIECGVCAYVCPANRPIVQFIKFGKAQILKQRAKSKR